MGEGRGSCGIEAGKRVIPEQQGCSCSHHLHAHRSQCHGSWSEAPSALTPWMGHPVPITALQQGASARASSCCQQQKNGRKRNFPLPFHLTYWDTPARFKDTAGSAIAGPQQPSASRELWWLPRHHRNTALLPAQPDQRWGSSFKGFEITFRININFHTAGSDHQNKLD